MAGCQCGMILYFAGNSARIVKGPSLVGSPSSTATFGPFGSDGGPSPHFRSFGTTITCVPICAPGGAGVAAGVAADGVAGLVPCPPGPANTPPAISTPASDKPTTRI